MSYAVRNDGQGWRAVFGAEEVGLDEWYCADNPPDPVPLPSTVEDFAAAAKNKRTQLLTSAATRMGPLQDAIEEDTVTAGELASLKLWRQYRIALNRIEQQAGFPSDVDWPTSPDASSAP